MGSSYINDTYGHPEGSAAIKKMAEILTQTFRDADILARPGGNKTNLPPSSSTLSTRSPKGHERLGSNLAAYNAASGKPYTLGISVGLVKIDFDAETTIPDVVKQADVAMYLDKKRRKGLSE